MEAMVELSRVEGGKEVILARILGGRGIRTRLCSMGLFPGVAITVLNRSKGGPVTLRVMNATLAIGRGMAQQIMVK